MNQNDGITTIIFKQNNLNLVKYQGTIKQIQDYFITGDGIMTKLLKNIFINSKPNGESEIIYSDGTKMICQFQESYNLQGNVKIIKDQDNSKTIYYENNKPIKIIEMQYQNNIYQFLQYNQYNKPINAIIKSIDGTYQYQGEINDQLQPDGKGTLKDGYNIYEKCKFINGELIDAIQEKQVDLDNSQNINYDNDKIITQVVRYDGKITRKLLQQQNNTYYGIVESDIFYYEGELNENLEMSGQGKYILKNDNKIYKGQFKNDQFDGLIDEYKQFQENDKQKMIQLSSSIYQNGQYLQRKIQNIINKQNIVEKQIIFNFGNESDGYQVQIIKYGQDDNITYQQTCNCYIDDNNQIVLFGKYQLQYSNGDQEFGQIDKEQNNIKEKEIINNKRIINVYQNNMIVKQYDQLKQQLTKYSQKDQNQIIYQYYGLINDNCDPQSKYGLLIFKYNNQIQFQYGEFLNGKMEKQYIINDYPIVDDKFQLFTEINKDNGTVKCQFFNYQKNHIVPIYIQTDTQIIYFYRILTQDFIKLFLEQEDKQNIITKLRFYGQIVQRELDYAGQKLQMNQ